MQMHCLTCSRQYTIDSQISDQCRALITTNFSSPKRTEILQIFYDAANTRTLIRTKTDALRANHRRCAAGQPLSSFGLKYIRCTEKLGNKTSRWFLIQTSRVSICSRRPRLNTPILSLMDSASC